jgi:MFS family permease
MSRRSLGRAISIWLVASLFVFYKYIIEVSPSVMGMQMMASYGIDGLKLGNLIAAYFYSYMLMQLPMGILLDRYGARIVLLGCIISCVLGNFLLAGSHTFYSAVAGRFLTGLGAAGAVIGCMKLIAMWFEVERFALMTGLMMTIGMLGAVFGELPLDYLTTQFGWQPALQILGGAGLVLFLLFLICVFDNSVDKADHTHGSSFKQMLQGLLVICKKPQSWLLSIFSGFVFAPISAFGGAWGKPFLQAVNHYSSYSASFVISGIFYGFALGAPIWGWLSDHFQRRLRFIAIGIVMALGMTVILFLHADIPPVFAFTLLFVFGFGLSAFVLSFSMIRESNALLFAATAIGFMNVFNSITSAVIDPLIGGVLDFFWGGELHLGQHVYSAHAYRMGMLAVPAALILALILLPLIKETHCRQVQ